VSEAQDLATGDCRSLILHPSPKWMASGTDDDDDDDANYDDNDSNDNRNLEEIDHTLRCLLLPWEINLWDTIL